MRVPANERCAVLLSRLAQLSSSWPLLLLGVFFRPARRAQARISGGARGRGSRTRLSPYRGFRGRLFPVQSFHGQARGRRGPRGGGRVRAAGEHQAQRRQVLYSSWFLVYPGGGNACLAFMIAMRARDCPASCAGMACQEGPISGPFYVCGALRYCSTFCAVRGLPGLRNVHQVRSPGDPSEPGGENSLHHAAPFPFARLLVAERPSSAPPRCRFQFFQAFAPPFSTFLSETLLCFLCLL